MFIKLNTLVLLGYQLLGALITAEQGESVVAVPHDCEQGQLLNVFNSAKPPEVTMKITKRGGQQGV